MAEPLRIVVAGGVGAMPFAGVAWQVMQYLEGLRRLGHRVFYLEDTERWPYDPVAETVSDDAGPAIAYVAELMKRCQLDGAWAYRDVAQDGALHGTSEAGLEHELAHADALLNISGVMVLREEHLRVPLRAYVETDPVLPQIEVAQGREFTFEFLAAHTHHFTYGENFGAPDCQVPLERFTYRPTRPPVILDWWGDEADAWIADPSTAQLDHSAFTTVANWRQTEKDVVWNGHKLTWSKDVQFMRVLELPERIETPLELALATDDPEVMDRLRRAGWGVRPAGALSKDIDAYRDYVRSSAGEFSVAKEQYASLRSGWFSDRTACYLAAGRPAVVQDTGQRLPLGEGLLTFSNLDEAVAAFEVIRADYPRQVRAARELAQDYLRAETVLGCLVDELVSGQ